MKKHNLLKPVAILIALVLLCIPIMPDGALSYLTGRGDIIMNPFTIALDCTTTVVEDYPVPDEEPPNTPVPKGTTIDYQKVVQVGNTGFIDCYVRVYIEFSEDDIKNKSKFSSDGVNWYSVTDYANHLPAGWTYNATDGYYYYKPVLYAENWDVVSSKLWYDEAFGEYFYPDSQKNVLSDTCITTPLISYVKTEFSAPVDIRSYDIHVYNESVPFYFGNDYAQAWDNYLAIMK